MNIGKKNNWLKLKVDFFSSPAVKKLRKIAGGDKYLIIYQKLMLLTVNTEGHYEYQKLEEKIEDELALILDEEVDNIKMALSFLRSTNLMQDIDINTVFFNDVPKLIGKYDDSSERVAKYRLRKRSIDECNALQNVTCNECNGDVTCECNECNAPRERERERERERVVQVQRVRATSEKPEPTNLDSPDYIKKMANNSFENWKQIAKEQNTKFTNSEWDTIYGYILAKPSLQPHQIRSTIITLNKWANEALDIEDALLTGQNYRALVKPRQRIMIDKKNNRLYGNLLIDHRNKLIEIEEFEVKQQQ
jgi:predicted phage replisome organizer